MGFQITVNGEVVWESEGDGMLVSEIQMSGERGDISLYRPTNEEKSVNVQVNVRNPYDSNMPLDVRDAINRHAMQTAVENAQNDGIVNNVIALPGKPSSDEAFPPDNETEKDAGFLLETPDDEK